MSKKDTGEILLNCFYQRKFFNMTTKLEGLTDETNFVFLFAEADETRFIIQDANSIVMYEIIMPEEEGDEEGDGNGSDDDNND